MNEVANDAIAFVDLEAQLHLIDDDIRAAIDKVLRHGRFIMGPEVFELEASLASWTGASECVTCSSGTDALVMTLMAWGIGPGDAVFVPAFTFAATAEAVSLVGATPIFIDVDSSTMNMDAASLRAALDLPEQAGLRATAIIAVDLFGLPADWQALNAIADEVGLHLMADAAQSLGGSTADGRVGTLAHATTTSFFPAKPLGCFGDGGAIFTDDVDLAARLRSVRIHGQGKDKYDNIRIGMNGRLDTIQAAILIEKLKIFDAELSDRAIVADRYAALLEGTVELPVVPDGYRSTWAYYTLRSEARDEVRRALEEDGIPTATYYPKPLHQQQAYSPYPFADRALEVSEYLADRVLSVPMHPYLSSSAQERIVAAVQRAHR